MRVTNTGVSPSRVLVTVELTDLVIGVPSLFVVVTGIVIVPVSDVISDASEVNDIVVNGELGVFTVNPPVVVIVPIEDIVLVVPPSDTTSVKLDGVAEPLPTEFEVIVWDVGKTCTSTFGGDARVLDNDIESVTSLLTPSLSVTVAVNPTCVELTLLGNLPNERVKPLLVTKSLPSLSSVPDVISNEISDELKDVIEPV